MMMQLSKPQCPPGLSYWGSTHQSVNRMPSSVRSEAHMSFNFSNFSKDYISDLTSTLEKLSITTLEEIWNIIEDARNSERTVHLIGNGGSAGTPSHSAGDWSKELKLRTISHTDNASSLTAWANDTDYENIFVGLLSTFINPGDVVIGYSGSGNSKNVINGIIYAKEKECHTIAITGNYNGMDGGKLGKIADVALVVPSESMERIEDTQLIINHIIKEAIKSNNGL
ncbi:MAG: phosphoheptose isomerase [Euryarchaeota archaeon]|nr:phosphoheptose isomerase [Euryarchaeota archaeon]